jgi:putative tryptophan/tyrosine transport system substrate-binding protein
MLETTPATRNTANLDALRAGLKELGYIEGQNLVIDYRSADGHDDRFPDLAVELIQSAPDVIVTRGTPAAVAASNATKTIPVVMASIGEPLRVVASLAHPGGNVTGLTALVRELQGKRVELLGELHPGIARIAYLANPDNPVSSGDWDDMSVAARSRGIETERLLVRKVEELEPVISAARQQGLEALVVQVDSFTQTNARLIADLAAEHRLPAIYQAKEFVDAGGLISYGVNYRALYRRAAIYVAKILSGAKPADLPVEQPILFELVVNMKTAKALGITVPQSVLLSADEVIE